MLTEKFDAFGEAMPVALGNKCEASSSASSIVGRIGRWLFWLLVVMILAARISYYPATPAFELSSAAGPSTALLR